LNPKEPKSHILQLALQHTVCGLVRTDTLALQSLPWHLEEGLMLKYLCGTCL